MANAKKTAAAKRSSARPAARVEALATDEELMDAPDAELGGEEPAAPVCPVCGELLAWHEQACISPMVALPADAPAGPETAQGPVYYAATPNYAYNVGQTVQAAINTRAHTVIWRGQVKERHPATGLVHRVNVYWLNDGYWDCYREEELQVA